MQGDSRQAVAEDDVTEEMIEAGVMLFSGKWSEWPANRVDLDQMVIDVYRAMVGARGLSPRIASKAQQ